MKNTYLIFITSLIYMNAAQGALDELEFEHIKAAISSEELIVEQEAFQALRLNLRACEIQKEENILPAACYAAFHKATRLNVEKDILLSLAQIDRACLAIANKTTEIKNTISREDNQPCFDRAEARVKINLYKSGHDY